MEKAVQITLIIVAGVLIFGFLAFATFSNIINPTQNTVTGQGTATVKAVPDLVGVYFSVETKASTSEEAASKNADIVEKLKNSLISKGLDKKEIQTLNFNVYPEYDWNSGTQKIKGYIASHQIRVELSTENSEKIGEVIDAGVSAGAGISYINFELSQELQNKYKSEALKLAAEDAKIKASSIAEGLGKKVGSLVSVSTSDFNYYPWRLYETSGVASAEDAKAATTNINPGEQEISASVTAIFKIR
mgnify:CR=1 FL=1